MSTRSASVPCISMNPVPLPQVKAMSAVDDDATLTQLAAAWLGLHQARGRCCAMRGGSERHATGTLWKGPLGTGPL